MRAQEKPETVDLSTRKGGDNMRRLKIFDITVSVFFLVLMLSASGLWAAEYKVDFADWEKQKNLFDDPRPYFLGDLSWKKVMPPEVYAKLAGNGEEMKRTWAEVVGFKAPDVVGKIAPEIKPGKYTYKDKEKYQFKELMIPEVYNMFAPATNYCANFPEIEVVPTRQYYYPLPIAKATLANIGKTKLDDQGYLDERTYVSGFPFPRPEGKFKAEQIVNNERKRYFNSESYLILQRVPGFNGSLKQDKILKGPMWIVRLKGRAWLEPHGWFDERAKLQGEVKGFSLFFLEPRDQYGNILTNVMYEDVDKYDNFLVYVNAMRRTRKFSATDTQDAVGGADVIYDDSELFNQKLSPKRFPYKYELIEEREYLLPSPTDGAFYLKEKDKTLNNAKFERRPVYVVKMTQLDKNYVYSERTLYYDKESQLLLYVKNKDQKGRLYRDELLFPGFHSDFGLPIIEAYSAHDYVNVHSMISFMYPLPTPWLTRDHISIRGLLGVK